MSNIIPFAQVGDILVFSAFFSFFLIVAYFKSILWLLRAALAFLFAHPSASLLSNFSFFKKVDLEHGFLILLLLFFVTFLVALRKMHFNFSYHSFWAKVLISLNMTLVLVYFLTSSFNPSLFVYDAFSSYESFILSPTYAFLMYLTLLSALIML